MPFARPTLTQLRSQVLADIAASDLPGADSLLRRAVLRVLGVVQAGLAHLHFGYIDWISKEAVPFTADQEFLEAWAGLVGVTRKAQTTAIGTAVFTGTTGSLIPTGTTLARGDGGAYVTTADGTVAGGTVSVPVAATLAGNIGNADAGTLVALSSAVNGVLSQGTITATGGFPAETDDALRTRMLEQYAAPPHGGDVSDYLEWCEAVPGVTRAWVRPYGMGPGTVVVYTMFDGDIATGGFPIGTAGCATEEDRDITATGDLLTVANAIFPLQPVTALVYAQPPVPHPQDIVINDLRLPENGAALIRAALADVLLRKGSPLGAPVYPSDFETAIAAVPGVGTFSLASPVVPVTAPIGSLLTVGNVSYGSTQ